MIIKNHEFTFAIPPEEVGMKTGATIHTMNGLQMKIRTIGEDETLPKTDGYWTKQHLKRGLSANGQPFITEEDAETEAKRLNMELTIPNEINFDDDDDEAQRGCPMHAP